MGHSFWIHTKIQETHEQNTNLRCFTVSMQCNKNMFTSSGVLLLPQKLKQGKYQPKCELACHSSQEEVHTWNKGHLSFCISRLKRTSLQPRLNDISDMFSIDTTKDETCTISVLRETGQFHFKNTSGNKQLISIVYLNIYPIS